MFYKFKKFVKSLLLGITRMFKSEPVLLVGTILSVPMIIVLAPKLAATLSVSPVLFCIALLLAIVPSVWRIIWNYTCELHSEGRQCECFVSSRRLCPPIPCEFPFPPQTDE